AEQAEAERPEVVAWRYGFSGGIVSDKACLDEWKSGGEYQSLMTVAQHERIVGELRAVIAQLRQHKNDYMDSGQQTYRALQNEIREREAEIARLDGLVSGRTAERDAALARVAELDKQCRDDVARALGLRPSQERGFAWSYLLASIKSCVKASEDTAQAQHSVPEGYALVPLEPTDDMLVAGQEAWTHKMERRGALEDCEEAGDVYRAMLAAAPGKEGV
ncbi:hypothetical protein, partial [Pseudomonas aeruginosa]